MLWPKLIMSTWVKNYLETVVHFGDTKVLLQRRYYLNDDLLRKTIFSAVLRNSYLDPFHRASWSNAWAGVLWWWLDSFFESSEFVLYQLFFKVIWAIQISKIRQIA